MGRFVGPILLFALEMEERGENGWSSFDFQLILPSLSLWD